MATGNKTSRSSRDYQQLDPPLFNVNIESLAKEEDKAPSNWMENAVVSSLCEVELAPDIL